MCEAEMFQCHDHNHTVETTEFEGCKVQVLDKFKVYHAPAVSLFAKKAFGCKDACAEAGDHGEESNCVTMCEAEMFQCHDHNHTVETAEFEGCKVQVLDKFKVYHAPAVALSAKKNKKQIVKPCAEACAEAGGHGEESNCVTMCEAEMYQCHDHNHTVAIVEFEACQTQVELGNTRLRGIETKIT